MPYCPNCRTFVDESLPACPKCGTTNPKYQKPVTQTQGQSSGYSAPPPAKKSGGFVKWLKHFFRTDDETWAHDDADIRQNTNFAILAYLGPLCFITLAAGRRSKYAMFHFCQGRMNLVGSVLWYVFAAWIWPLLPDIIGQPLAFLTIFLAPIFPVFLVLGLWHVIRKEARTLPLYGRIPLMSKLFPQL